MIIAKMLKGIDNLKSVSFFLIRSVRRTLRQYVISSLHAQLDVVLKDHVADGCHIDVMFSFLRPSQVVILW